MTNKQTLFFLATFFLFSSCTISRSLPKSETYQIEATLHKTKTELEDLKHHFHTQDLELSMLKEKTSNQENLMTSLKEETFQVHQKKIKENLSQVSLLEQKVTFLETKQDQALSKLHKLAQTVDDIVKASLQNKERLNEMEKVLASFQTKWDQAFPKKQSQPSSSLPLTE